MRRDYFTLEVTNVGSPGVPTVHIDFDGPSDQLVGRFTDDDGEPLKPDDIDVAYRLQSDLDGDTDGVVAVTNRVTGEFILELNATADDVLEFVDAAREYDTDGEDDDHYRVRVSVDGEILLEHDKRILLVYDAEGGLLRQHSLIPSGVEL